MADDETLAWVSLLVGALGTVFLGIRALKIATSVAISTGLAVCPNCGQPFDASLVQGFSPGKYPRLSNGVVTCPRCWFTFEV